MSLKRLLIDPGQLIGPGEYWPDVLEEISPRALILCTVLLVQVLYDVVE